MSLSISQPGRTFITMSHGNKKKLVEPYNNLYGLFTVFCCFLRFLGPRRRQVCQDISLYVICRELDERNVCCGPLRNFDEHYCNRLQEVFR